MSQDSGQPPRQPPRFVPTLTNMVRAEAEPEVQRPVAGSVMPAAFADLLKDWPALGATPPAALEAAETVEPPKVSDLGGANHDTEQVARRAEALVMQRLPQVMAGLVAQAVRDALKN